MEWCVHLEFIAEQATLKVPLHWKKEHADKQSGWDSFRTKIKNKNLKQKIMKNSFIQEVQTNIAPHP